MKNSLRISILFVLIQQQLLILLIQSSMIPFCHGFGTTPLPFFMTAAGTAPPIFGLGAMLFQPKGLTTVSSNGDMKVLQKASDFFVEAFWVGKVGGGTNQLTSRQKSTLDATQFMEFRSRYAGNKRGQAELIICKSSSSNNDDEIIACAGIEVSPIPKGGLKGETTTACRAPLMSNLAVSRKYRRRGIAELIVKEVERVAQYEMGYNDCYLYVEERNIPAVRLYKKLGYRPLWTDSSAKTLLPTSNGNLKNYPTTIVCMKKRLGRGVLGRLWPF